LKELKKLRLRWIDRTHIDAGNTLRTALQDGNCSETHKEEETSKEELEIRD